MVKNKLAVAIFFGAGLLSSSVHAEYWRINLKNGQSGIMAIDRFIFEGGKETPAYAIRNLSVGKYEFTLGSGLFTPRLPFEEISSFQYTRCREGQGRDSWMTCDTKVKKKNGEELSRDASNPWFLGRRIDDGKWAGTVKEFSGTIVYDSGKIEQASFALGWQDTVGSYRIQRTIDGIAFLSEQEAKEQLSNSIDKISDAISKSEKIKFPALFDEFATEEQKNATLAKAVAYWREKYLAEAKFIFEGNPTISNVELFSKKQPIEKASSWKSVDFDGLAPKASMLFASLKSKEDALAQQKQQVLLDLLTKSPRGTKEFCVGKFLDAHPAKNLDIPFDCQSLGAISYRKLSENGWIIVNVMPRQVNQLGQLATIFDFSVEKNR